ncbi:MAG: hypothetical protein O7G88_04190 [bacterium]|nr:hypothetical protein [bacterium]
MIDLVWQKTIRDAALPRLCMVILCLAVGSLLAGNIHAADPEPGAQG